MTVTRTFRAPCAAFPMTLLKVAEELGVDYCRTSHVNYSNAARLIPGNYKADLGMFQGCDGALLIVHQCER